MVNSATDFFKIENNFLKIKNVTSIQIIKAQLGFAPDVSIVIPAYKRTDLLKQAVESALGQESYSNFELIVVDDDPTRNCKTEELLKSFTDPRLSYYKNEQNIGPVNNMNRCFELASGKWLLLLNDDDLLLPFYLKECMEQVTQHPQLAILKPRWYHWNDDGNKLIVPEITTTNNLIRVYEVSELITDHIGASTCVIINREKLFLLGGFNPNYFPNFDKSFVTLASHYFEVYKWDRVAFVYRWLSNDSLRIEVLRGFFNNDYFLFRFLLKHFNVPHLLADAFLNFKFRNMTGYYQIVNKDFTFDKSAIGLKDSKKIPGKISYKLIKYWVAMYIKYYQAFGETIFRRRLAALQKSTG